MIRKWLVLSGCMMSLVWGLLLVPGIAFAANTNPINWKIVSTYYGNKGQDIPLRYGQHNQGTAQGFGLYHIEDDHYQLPDSYDLSETLEYGKCSYQSSNDSYQCLYDSSHGDVIAIYTERVDSRSKDGRPVGIITAYYEDGSCFSQALPLRHDVIPNC